MSSQQTFEEFCQQKVNEGHKQGVEEMVQLAMLASERLARLLTLAEQKGLSAKLVELGADRTGERLRELSPEQLPHWLDGAEPE